MVSLFLVKLENLAWEREVVGQIICFCQRQEMMSWLLYDVIIMSLIVEAPYGGETSSRGEEYQFALATKNTPNFLAIWIKGQK